MWGADNWREVDALVDGVPIMKYLRDHGNMEMVKGLLYDKALGMIHQDEKAWRSHGIVEGGRELKRIGRYILKGNGAGDHLRVKIGGESYLIVIPPNTMLFMTRALQICSHGAVSVARIAPDGTVTLRDDNEATFSVVGDLCADVKDGGGFEFLNSFVEGMPVARGDGFGDGL